ncbi:nuclear transport factor 2 family protein [Roseibacterium beibuensis]|uniref:nuclear transport factor 2 family protein n=1 Tax=[Roseibacterium] beibuensis TaxID=1193142 RepID=UPI00217DE066|nr:nuclear transport factor 2 family protein [Roseibacterium beibuensis]MCS6627628.1 nuclear transport factor 2 family protein [Roseibacterium beibuensis]
MSAHPDRRSLLAGAGALPLAAAGGPSATTQDSAWQAFDRYRRLINQHDFDRLAADVIAPDAVFVFSDRIDRGIDAVRAGFLRSWSVLPDEVYSMTGPAWLLDTSNAAVCAFRYAYRGTMIDGRRLAGGGRGVNLFRPSARGWRLTYEQLTPDTTPAG